MTAANGGKPKAAASKLSPATNAKRNTKAGRAAMPKSDFALPGKYRIDDKPHAVNALARVAQVGTPAEKAHVQRAVKAKFPSINVTGIKKAKG